jgi:two-component system, OmpR family, response regulator
MPLAMRMPTTEAGVGGLSGLKVLVVDDQPDILFCTGYLLMLKGAEVRMAASASEAWKMLKSYAPDVVLSDLCMPEIDGFQFLERARSTFKGSCPPAAVLSAESTPEYRERATRAGFSAYLVKPIDQKELTSVVANLAGRG